MFLEKKLCGFFIWNQRKTINMVIQNMLGNLNPGEIYFENSSKYYLKSSLNKLRIVLHSMLRKDFVVFSKSQNHLGMVLEIKIVVSVHFERLASNILS